MFRKPNGKESFALVNEDNKLEIVGGGAGGGDATADKQDDMITELKSIDNKILTNYTSGVATAIHQQVFADANGGGTLYPLKLDTPLTRNLCVRDTVLETKITKGSDDAVDSATGLQQVLIYGRKDDTPSGLRAVKVVDNGALNTNDGGLNGKISAGTDATLTTNTQQVLCYGRDAQGNLDALKTDQEGHLEVVPDYFQGTRVLHSGSQVINTGTNHTFTTSGDKNGSNNFNLLIESTGALSGTGTTIVKVLGSDDDLTYYNDNSGGITINSTTATNVMLRLTNIPTRFIKVNIEYSGAGGSSITIDQIIMTYTNGI